MNGMSLIEKFTTKESQGKCTDSVFEFGNLYRKEFKCSFCDKDGDCYYSEKCDRRNIPNNNLGWRIS